MVTQHDISEAEVVTGVVKISASWTLSSPDDAAISIDIPVAVHYVFSVSGELEISFAVFLPSTMPPPPRVGLRMAICSSLAEVNWLGLGPYEAYDDRCEAVHMGEFSMGVDELHTPYVFPQECGRRQQPRYSAIAMIMFLLLICH